MLERPIGEEAPPSAGVYDPAPFTLNSEASHRSSLVLAHDDNRAGAHMLFFADDGLDSCPAVVIESLGRIFEVTVLPARLAWGHRRRQVNQPLRDRREPAQDYERGERVFLPNRNGAMEPGAEAVVPS